MVTTRKETDTGEQFAALRNALAEGPLLGFDTATWTETAAPQAKPAFVGVTNTFTVTNNNDSGAGSLRAAVASANAAAGGSLITFDPSLAGQATITLQSTLTITNGVYINGDFNGDGTPDITISGNNAVGVFTIDSGSNSQVGLVNLNIVGGKATGTGGANGNGANAPGSTGGNAAGGVYVKSGSVNLQNDTFSNNTATGGFGGSGGFTFNPPNPPQNKGAGGAGGSAAGAVYVEPAATVQASNLTFLNNSATAGMGGSGPNGAAASGTADQNSNSETVRDAVCFASGTRILTDRGDVAVEDLKVGDLAVTASGAQRPIRWIGHRRTDCSRHPKPEHVMPVRISAGTFGPGKPARDLVVSPGHSLCLDVSGEVLIPAVALVNGTTITLEAVETVTYWHIELDSHDILIAEGQPAESYIDLGNRGFFAESGVVSLGARPDADAAARSHADFCRPFHDAGAVVEQVRTQMGLRAETLGWTLVEPETWADVHLEVDGQVVRPKTSGLFAYFVLPPGAQDVWLISPTSIPCHVGDNADRRPLGLCLSRLSLHDGLGKAKPVALDDPLLRLGFHAMAKDHRWTAGRAQLPAQLLQGMEGQVLLLLDLFAPALPRWIGPQQTAAEPRLQPVAVAA